MQRKSKLLRSVGLFRKKPMVKRKKPPQKITKQLAEDTAILSELVRRFLLDNPECAMKIKGVCTLKATTVHHPGGRAGEKLLDVSKFIGGCLPCHYWVQTHSKEAIEMGLSERRNV